MIPGQEHYDITLALLGQAGKILAQHDESNPGAAVVLAEAQVRATLAVYEALAGIAGELTFMRKMRDL